jgi:hypothetical protein
MREVLPVDTAMAITDHRRFVWDDAFAQHRELTEEEQASIFAGSRDGTRQLRRYGGYGVLGRTAAGKLFSGLAGRPIAATIVQTDTTPGWLANMNIGACPLVTPVNLPAVGQQGLFIDGVKQ